MQPLWEMRFWWALALLLFILLLMLIYAMSTGNIDQVLAKTSQNITVQQYQQPQGLEGLALDCPDTRFVTDENGGVPWPHELPGDLDGDCRVTIIDIMLVASQWGSECEKDD